MGASRAHLDRTVITDRRGKVTTVYRRPEQQAAGRSLPQPSLAGQKTPPAGSAPEQLEDDIVVAVLERMSANSSEPEPEQRDEALRARLEELMIKDNGGRALSKGKEQVIRLLTNAQTAAVVDAWSRDGFGKFFSALVTEDSFTYRQLAGMALLYDAGAFSYLPTGSKAAVQKQTRAAAELYHHLRTHRDDLGLDEDTVRNLAEASPEDKRTAAAYAELFNAVREVNQYRLLERDLVTLAFHDADQPREVVELIRSTGRTDVPTLRGLLAGAPSAIADGYL